MLFSSFIHGTLAFTNARTFQITENEKAAAIYGVSRTLIFHSITYTVSKWATNDDRALQVTRVALPFAISVILGRFLANLYKEGNPLTLREIIRLEIAGHFEIYLFRHVTSVS